MYLQKNKIAWNEILTIKRVILLFCIISILPLTGCAAKVSASQTVKAGAIDLSEWDSTQNELINLSGEWEFYWQKLLIHDDFLSSSIKPSLSAEVPRVWNSYKINGKSLPGFGYATYKLSVTNTKPGQRLAIKMPTVSTAYNLYINDELVASNGRVGTDEQHFTPEYRPVMAEFIPPSEDFNIILQVANFSYARGGIWYTIFIGSVESVINYDKTIGYKDLFLIGAFIIMALYYLCIFFMRKEDKGSLYFVLICLIAIGRTAIYGDYVINRILPWAGYPVIVFIDYITLVWFPIAFFSLIIELFPEQTSLKIKRLIIIYAVLLSLFIMLSPIHMFTSLVYPIEVTILAIAIYAVICTIRAFSKFKVDAALIFTGAMAVTLGGIHDILHQNNIIISSIGELSSVGFLIMLFLQAYILSKRFKESVEAAIASELRSLQAQIKPHFLYNTINTIVAVSHYDPTKVRELLVTFSNYLRRSFDFSHGHMVMLEKEIELAKSYVDIEKARFEERLSVQFDIEANTSVSVPVLMLQPVIENAIHHGLLPKSGAGNICVNIKEYHRQLMFSVSDDGAGMDEQQIKRILSDTEHSGVALINIHKRLQRLYGKGLSITSKKGAGTTVRWCIPLPGRGKAVDKSHSD